MFFYYGYGSIFYEKYGNSEKKMIILGGWGDTRKSFMNIINYFKDDYTIYIFDYPGFGKSAFPDKDLSIYDYTNIIRDFMDENDIVNPVIISHSFGGRIAILLAGYYKEPIEKIIMIDTAGIKNRKKFFVLFKEKLYKFLKNLNIFLPKKKRNKYINKLLNKFGSSDYKALPGNMMKSFRNIIDENLVDYLKFIDSEVLILWGEKDTDTPLKNGILKSKLIPDSALIVLKNATHYSYLEHPILMNNIIDCFLNNKNLD